MHDFINCYTYMNIWLKIGIWILTTKVTKKFENVRIFLIVPDPQPCINKMKVTMASSGWKEGENSGLGCTVAG